MAEIRIERGRDNFGRARPDQLVAYVGRLAVATALRASGSEVWVAERFGRRRRYVTNLSEVAAQELLLGWAREAAS